MRGEGAVALNWVDCLEGKRLSVRSNCLLRVSDLFFFLYCALYFLSSKVCAVVWPCTSSFKISMWEYCPVIMEALKLVAWGELAGVRTPEDTKDRRGKRDYGIIEEWLLQTLLAGSLGLLIKLE